jgi:hypothetical protein
VAEEVGPPCAGWIFPFDGAEYGWHWGE